MNSEQLVCLILLLGGGQLILFPKLIYSGKLHAVYIGVCSS